MEPIEKDTASERVEMAKAPEPEGIVMPESLASLDDAEYQKLGRRATLKMDIAIMPIMVIMYILNYLDRQNIASAKLANIEEELGLTPVDYQTSVSILFCGYSKSSFANHSTGGVLIASDLVLMQVPSNMVVGRIKWPAIYICLGMAAWGAISACMAAVHNFAGLLVCRVLLGMVEAIFFPGALYFLSLFYNRKQFALRTAILYSGSQLGNAFGGLFAVGILELDGVHGLSGWRWV